MKFNLLSSVSSLAIGGLVVASLPTAANAGLNCTVVAPLTCSETVTPASFPVNGTQTASLSQFNLGGNARLTSVILTESGSFSTTGLVTYTGAGTGVFTFNSTGTMNLFPDATAPVSFPTVTLTRAATTQTYSLTTGQSATYNGARAFRAASTTASVAGFSGNGSFLVDFTGTAGISVGGTSAVSTSLNSTFFPTVTITYDYSYPAPEPASMAVLGAGLTGLGIIRRRRNKA
jgi:hypothetical protein